VHLSRSSERRVHGAEHKPPSDEGERREVEALHPAHAEKARDVERRTAEAERRDPELVTSPMRGCSRNSQPMAAAKPGISRPIAIQGEEQRLGGKSVRSASSHRS